MRLTSTAVLLLLCLLPTRTSASTVRYLDDAQLIARSDRVIHGRVMAQRTAPDPSRPRFIYTVTTLSVIEDLTGVESDTIEVWELGGALGRQSMYVGGAARFEPGAEVVVCLRRGPLGLHSVGMELGKFEVTAARGAPQRLERRLEDVIVRGGPAIPSNRSLQEFRRLARQVTGRTPRRGRSADAPVRLPQEPQAFTYLGNGRPGSATGARWIEADSSRPIYYYVNSAPRAPSLGFDPAQEIQTALDAWTSPADASLILEYRGTTRQATEGPWVGIPSHSVVISFEDPEDTIEDPVLALTVAYFNDGSGGVLHGVTFDGFVDAAIWYQNAADLPVEFRQPPGFTRVITHEIGHTIGLGHSEAGRENIMYSSCCYATTPLPPSLGPDDLAGLVYLYPESSSAPGMTLDKSSLRFSALTSGGVFVAQTAPQFVRLTPRVGGRVTWQATATQPWLQVSPASGAGAATLRVSVSAAAGLPTAGTRTGSVVVTYAGASIPSEVLSVTLRLIPNGMSAPPVGFVDTPVENAARLTGAVPFTGWALDDVELASVSVCRAAVAGEAAAPDGRCGGWAHVYVGDAVFIEGARPDVQLGYPGYPRNGEAGWGLMVLTNMLPAQGNGTFHFSMWARDREGYSTLLGTRTVTCDNAHATLPFGTIDTPGQGETISGNAYLNFGWVMTQRGKMIPGDGSTLMVYVDGQAVGRPAYGFYRADIATMFPGLANSDGAVGYRYLDTTTLSNGLHTISWSAADNTGAATGLGSRYFRVSNGSAEARSTGALTSAATPRVAPAIAALALEPGSIQGRRGWGLDGPWRPYESDADGRIVVLGEEGDRFELQLAAGDVTGYLRVGEALQSLPIGSRLDPASGLFTWAPGVGFIGGYDLVFVHGPPSEPLSRQEVRIVLRPKGTSPQVVIDTPAAHHTIGQPFVLAGWAADLAATDGTGIDTLHVWAYPVGGAAPVFLGVAPGAPRFDVAAAYGQQFRDAGYSLVVKGLAPGTYDLAVFAWSSGSNGFLPAAVVRVTLR